MVEISFTSKIVPLKQSDFFEITSAFNSKSLVDFPWTIDMTRTGKDVYTKNVCDCSSCLITNESEAILMHLDPMVYDNHIFSKVLIYLRNHINLNDKNLHAFLIGSKNKKNSQDIWNKFVKLLDNLKIQTTILKDGKSPTHIAYRKINDEVLISNFHIEKLLKKGADIKDALSGGFQKIKIAPCDKI